MIPHLVIYSYPSRSLSIEATNHHNQHHHQQLQAHIIISLTNPPPPPTNQEEKHPSLPSRDQSCPSKRPITIECRRASCGYTAALLDASRCDGAVDEVERDVARLARMLRLIDEGKVREAIIYGGGFHRHLVVLLKMMARKGKAGLVGEVLEEFGRICCALGQGDQMATII
ncbi:hypothetical protein QJS04_geneDACA019899 [Acorus gramineus]|uniref:Uncharacterized protein n=1 Tax=Acorus gramineus TaxID=55184 RepID=A0AAV9A193_ACOGR|nr:hypothetical protein QJS04_geneDACA019899 [Acorus gramineus]